jgi:hypothetical protein
MILAKDLQVVSAGADGADVDHELAEACAAGSQVPA